MLRVSLTCVAALAAFTAPAGSRAAAFAQPAVSERAPQQEFRAARVEIVGFHEAAVLAALRLRLPRLPIERHGGPAPGEAPYVYLAIVRTADTAGTLRAITSDGRAYERGFAIEIGQEVRVAASTAASLLFSIEEGVVAPDRKDVAIPEAPLATPLITEPPIAEPPITEPPITEPRLAEPRLAEPPAPVDEPAVTPAAPDPKGERPAPMNRWEFAAVLHGAALLGLGPNRYADAFAGAGAGLGLELRGPRGAAAALELRGLGRSEAGLGVGRLRIAVGGGYTLRRGRFELPMLLAVAIEPWWVTQSGGSAAIFSGQAEAARHPLFGGYLRVTPALRIALKRGPLIGLRVGPRLELGGAFVFDGGARIVGLKDTTGAQRFRLGGLELSVGLELALQFAVP